MENKLNSLSALTIFYREITSSEVQKYLSANSKENVLNEKTQYEVIIEGKNIKMTIKKEFPGNEVAVTKLKLLNFLRKTYDENANLNPYVRHMLVSEYSMGIVLEPQISEKDPRLLFISKLLHISECVVFDGRTLLNHDLKEVFE